MLGPEGVMQLISARLQAALPAKVAELRARLNLDDPAILPDDVAELAAPEVFMSEPEDTPIEQAAFPVVYLIDRTTEQIMGMERDQFADTFRVPYQVSMVIYVRDSSFTLTKQQLRRMHLAVVETLLGQLQLAQADGQTVTLDPLSWKGRIGIPGNVENSGIIAGSVIDTVWHADETLTPNIGLQVSDVDADVTSW